MAQRRAEHSGMSAGVAYTVKHIQKGLTLLAEKGGKVSFVANTARDSAEATCYYEIIRIWYN